MHDVLVRKAQDKAAAGVDAFKQQQRNAVAATVDAQRADAARQAQAQAAVRGSLPPWHPLRQRALPLHAALTRGRAAACAQAQRQPNMSPQFLDAFGRSAR